MRTVPQTLDHLLALRNRGAVEGRHAARAALRPLPQPRPGLLEGVRVLPGDLAAVGRGVHALLVAGLAADRRPPGSSLLNVPSPWLFPGRRPGSALTEDALAQRLHAHGISPRQGRSTALFTLAAEIPAAILAKTLGIHVQAAIQWQNISAGDWAAYAADVSRRPGHTHGPTGQA